jgi:serine phosphatase RsbU (regulator of sigma subunit)
LLRAGHEPPILITPNDITEIAGDHGPALGLEGASDWPLQRVHLPLEAAIMFFTDGVTERRRSPGSPPLGLDDLLSELDSRVLLMNAPIDALDATLDSLFPHGPDEPVDDLAVMLVNLTRERGQS